MLLACATMCHWARLMYGGKARRVEPFSRSYQLSMISHIITRQWHNTMFYYATNKRVCICKRGVNQVAFIQM